VENFIFNKYGDILSRQEEKEQHTTSKLPLLYRFGVNPKISLWFGQNQVVLDIVGGTIFLKTINVKNKKSDHRI
jgi:hypothetical protein